MRGLFLAGDSISPADGDRDLSDPVMPKSYSEALIATAESQPELSALRSEPFQRLMADHGVSCSMSRAGNVWDNAAMESFFSSMKTERVARKIYRTRDDARADLFDYIERFYNPKRRHSTLGYLSPIEFEQMQLA